MTPADLARLRETVGAMSNAPWHRRTADVEDGANNVLAFTVGHLRYADAAGIVALRNHADELLGLADLAKEWADHRQRCHNDNPDAVIAHLQEAYDGAARWAEHGPRLAAFVKTIVEDGDAPSGVLAQARQLLAEVDRA